MRSKLVAVAYSALVLFVTMGSAAGQSSEAALLSRKIDLNLQHATFLQTLSMLSVTHRVPIGLERDAEYWNRVRNLMSFENGQVNWKEGTIRITSGTLKEVLDSLVAQEPIYRWEVRDGVINVYPVQSRDPVLQKLLETQVDTFATEKGMNNFQIHETILALPELKTWLQTENLEVKRGVQTGRRSIYTNDEVKIDVSNATFRSVLNKVVKDSEYKLWVIDRIGEKRECLEISF